MRNEPLANLAPEGAVSDYDPRHLLTYAELLDAARLGVDWRTGALAILGIDPAVDADRAQACWESHLTRARWITGAGLGAAICAFDRAAIR